MTQAGDKVRTADGFEGVLLDRHGNAVGPGYIYLSIPGDLNIAVFAIWNQESGEVRYSTKIEPVA